MALDCLPFTGWSLSFCPYALFGGKRAINYHLPDTIMHRSHLGSFQTYYSHVFIFMLYRTRNSRGIRTLHVATSVSSDLYVGFLENQISTTIALAQNFSLQGFFICLGGSLLMSLHLSVCLSVFVSCKHILFFSEPSEFSAHWYTPLISAY